MDKAHGEHWYTSSRVDDNTQGYAGVELYRKQGDIIEKVASILFWDASGQFFAQTFSTDIPLAILESLIAEAKDCVDCG